MPDHSEADSFIAEKGEAESKCFEALFNNFYKKLCRYAKRLTRSPQIAEEVVQDVFMSLWKRGELLEDSSSLEPYLYKAVRNRSYDYLKHKKVIGRWQMTLPNPAFQLEEHPTLDSYAGQLSLPDEALQFKELEIAYERALSNLPASKRIVFEKSRKHGKTYSEIAIEMGISVKTVEKRISKTFSSLKDELEPYLPPDVN